MFSKFNALDNKSKFFVLVVVVGVIAALSYFGN